MTTIQANPTVPNEDSGIATGGPPAGETVSRAITGETAASGITVETRFGTFTFDDSNTVFLPQGVIGFPQFHRFGLTAIADPRMGQFKLLQSLDEPDLSFLVLPVILDGKMIRDPDIDDACAKLGLARADAAFLLIVTLRKEAEGISVSTNLRAPIVLDTVAQVGRQYVMPNPEYPIRQML